jgi:DNA-binding NarL/FixJ family response regulator
MDAGPEGNFMINILVVEDMDLLRDSLEKIINGQDDMQVVGCIADADEACALCRKLTPDLALIDVVTGTKANGIAAAARIRREMPDVKIVIMTALPEITFMDAARKAGAHSFVYKDSDSLYLLSVIRNTMNGRGTYPGPNDAALANTHFSDAEMTVVRLVCKGKDRHEIADALKISESTVKTLFSSILNKTGFGSITKFSVYAVAHGFIVPDHSE